MSAPTNFETVLGTGQIVAGQYRVDELIAQGGMAAVWAGVNQHTGKRVALKVILRSFASNDEVAELFRREALSASKINHPNVVTVFDVIDHEDMTCIVMELLAGETLASYLARAGPLKLDATVALLLPAMRGVAAANAQGVVHRDLKPANIFLCRGSDGCLLTTKVLDFGISVMMGLARDGTDAALPHAGFGTPAYMAPEAIELSPNIDGRADVYGFGVLFFEALTGKVPFPGLPGMELLGHILTDPAPRMTLYRSDLPANVVRLVDCALAKKPSDRYADMEHLIRATEDLLLAPPPSPRAQAPSEPPGLIDGARPAPSRTAATATTARRARQKQVPHRDGRRLVYERVSLGAVLLVFASVAAWSVVAASPKHHDPAGAVSDSPVRDVPMNRPFVTRIPSLTSLPPSPASIPELNEPAGPTVMQVRPTSPRPPPRHLYRGEPTAHALHPAAFLNRRSPLHNADLPDLPKARPAGALSSADF